MLRGRRGLHPRWEMHRLAGRGVPMSSRRRERARGVAASVSTRTRLLLAMVLLAATAYAAMTLATGSTLAHAAGANAEARAAGTLNVKDEGHLHLVHESGSELVEEGSATGTLPGTVRVRFNVGATVSAQFTIYAHGGGSISGHGSGSLHSTGTYATFGGSLAVTGGSGRYRHAHGSGGIYGAINRRTYAITVQTIGKLSY